MKQPQVKTLPQPPDCGFNRKFQEFIPNDYGIEICEDIERKECPNPECKSKNFAAVISEQNAELPSLERKQGKYRHILLEGRPYPDGKGCTCLPFKKEMEFEAAATEAREKIGNPHCLFRYVLNVTKKFTWTGL